MYGIKTITTVIWSFECLQTLGEILIPDRSETLCIGSTCVWAH